MLVPGTLQRITLNHFAGARRDGLFDEILDGIGHRQAALNAEHLEACERVERQVNGQSRRRSRGKFLIHFLHGKRLYDKSRNRVKIIFHGLPRLRGSYPARSQSAHEILLS